MLADPLRVPKYTVTPRPRSRWYSSVSTSPKRTVRLRPDSTLDACFRLARALARALRATRPAARCSKIGLLQGRCIMTSVVRVHRYEIASRKPPLYTHMDYNDDIPEGPSKFTGKARDAEALQELGAELVELPGKAAGGAGRCRRILRDAIELARRITSHGAQKRQRQYIGRLMRELDAGTHPRPTGSAAWHRPGLQGPLPGERALARSAYRRRRYGPGGVPGPASRRRIASTCAASCAMRPTKPPHGRPPRHARELFRYIQSLAEQRMWPFNSAIQQRVKYVR